MTRIERVVASMKEKGVEQLIVTDSNMVFYLTDCHISGGSERLLALLLRQDGNHRILVNTLNPAGFDPGMEIIWYSDSDDCVSILAGYMYKEGTVAVDRTMAASFLLRFMDVLPDCRFVNSSFIIDYVRQIKDADEQRRMIESSLACDRVMARIIPALSRNMDEIELDYFIRGIFSEECEGMSFLPIGAYGKGAADPHHHSTHDRPQKGDCVVLDIGGMLGGYASDMTRTVFMGEVSDRHREIYEIVREANRRGEEAAKPGARMCDVDNAARSYIEEKGFGKYFTHRTGHSIGIDDHEFGDVSSSNTDIIRPGQCFSVEPGIYIEEENIGVRIEDIVLITEDGCKVLNHYTKDLIIVPFEE